jgi:hypothetical protein
MDYGPQCHQRLPPDELHHRAEEEGAAGVHHPEADHHVADPVHPQGTRDVRLQNSKDTYVQWGALAKLRVLTNGCYGPTLAAPPSRSTAQASLITNATS